MTRPLILASASPRRRALLRTLGLPYRVIEPRIPEAQHPHWPAATLVTHNAVEKARAVAAALTRGIVIGADTLVVLGRAYLGKPRDARDARRMLRDLGGRTHRVYTGVCVIDVDRGLAWRDLSVTRVTMRRLRPPEIARYLDRVRPWDKAGAYAVQDLANMIIDRLDGSLSNVIGLPLDVVERRLRQCGLLPSAGGRRDG